MDLPEFKRWPSIQRLSSETMYLTEKCDGSNAIIHVTDDGIVLAGSRERWLSNPDGTPCDKKVDNFLFSAWVYERRESLLRFGPGTHYGEFHGAGIQRNYGLKNRRFASFEFWRPDIDGINPDVCKVPLLYEGEAVPNQIDFTVDELRKSGSVLYPGFMKPEGIVVTFKNMNTCKFKRLCENDKIHKYQQTKPTTKPVTVTDFNKES